MGIELGSAGETLAAIVVSDEISKGQDHSHDFAGKNCGNCGTGLTGPYCHSCGQSAHIHRSLLHMVEELLHGVFHFDTKAWRTIPALIFKPGKLTKEYIQGKRTSYVSPLALFLFLIFLMFYVFSWTVNDSSKDFMMNTPETRAEIVKELDALKLKYEEQKKNDALAVDANKIDFDLRDDMLESFTEIRDLQEKLDQLDENPRTKDDWQAGLDNASRELATLEAALKEEKARLNKEKTSPPPSDESPSASTERHRDRTEEIKHSMHYAEMDVKYYTKKLAKAEKELAKAELKKAIKQAASAEDTKAAKELGVATKESASADTNRSPQDDASDSKVSELYSIPYIGKTIAHADQNRELTIYKMKKNAASLAFLLMPLSLPFLWLMFAFKRKVVMFDHAVFSLYSLSFMCILMATISILSKIGWGGVAAILFTFIPPIHMYKQLRYAYDLGRFATLWRTVALLFIASISLTLYAAIITYLSA
ncbi:DUF3667 domain-containing protein [Undibacterium fentianense]|uniref:DUF3667 domain-containing protein n=1 Tax=Undibacterium fentianense TaxID=2828728 RepID=A0A941E747_9BURK|nr:DUF3667 domain-containing protein [Undibacterium fentianense]MBR7800968.1 DUF3667 domain-containing protein [Undibacterium fentianense]